MLLETQQDVSALFQEYNSKYFQNKLESVQLRWSDKMTLSAGQCSPTKKGVIEIALSHQILQLRPFEDTVSTLLHEMIHAYLYLEKGIPLNGMHCNEFILMKDRINAEEKCNITVYHSFEKEVEMLQRHKWRCNLCKEVFSRAINKAPSIYDVQFNSHKLRCAGQFIKFESPSLDRSTSPKALEKQREFLEKFVKRPKAASSDDIFQRDDSLLEGYRTCTKCKQNISFSRFNDHKCQELVKRKLNEFEVAKPIGNESVKRPRRTLSIDLDDDICIKSFHVSEAERNFAKSKYEPFSMDLINTKNIQNPFRKDELSQNSDYSRTPINLDNNRIHHINLVTEDDEFLIVKRKMTPILQQQAAINKQRELEEMKLISELESMTEEKEKKSPEVMKHAPKEPQPVANNFVPKSSQIPPKQLHPPVQNTSTAKQTLKPTTQPLPGPLASKPLQQPKFTQETTMKPAATKPVPTPLQGVKSNPIVIDTPVIDDNMKPPNNSKPSTILNPPTTVKPIVQNKPVVVPPATVKTQNTPQIPIKPTPILTSTKPVNATMQQNNIQPTLPKPLPVNTAQMNKQPIVGTAKPVAGPLPLPVARPVMSQMSNSKPQPPIVKQNPPVQSNVSSRPPPTTSSKPNLPPPKSLPPANKPTSSIIANSSNTTSKAPHPLIIQSTVSNLPPALPVRQPIPVGPPAAEPAATFTCDFCGKKYISHEILKKHMTSCSSMDMDF